MISALVLLKRRHRVSPERRADLVRMLKINPLLKRPGLRPKLRRSGGLAANPDRNQSPMTHHHRKSAICSIGHRALNERPIVWNVRSPMWNHKPECGTSVRMNWTSATMTITRHLVPEAVHDSPPTTTIARIHAAMEVGTTVMTWIARLAQVKIRYEAIHVKLPASVSQAAKARAKTADRAGDDEEDAVGRMDLCPRKVVVKTAVSSHAIPIIAGSIIAAPIIAAVQAVTIHEMMDVTGLDRRVEIVRMADVADARAAAETGDAETTVVSQEVERPAVVDEGRVRIAECLAAAAVRFSQPARSSKVHLKVCWNYTAEATVFCVNPKRITSLKTRTRLFPVHSWKNTTFVKAC